jgi:MarR family transcriptional regulator for hemolysin
MKPQRTPTGLKLALTAKAVGQAFNAALAEQGGSLATWHILRSLKAERWRTQHELAQTIGIEGPTLTRHLDGLEEAGLVKRTRDVQDRRAISVELTHAGRAAHAQMLNTVRAFTRRLEAGFSTAELDRLHELLGRLTDNIQRD